VTKKLSLNACLFSASLSCVLVCLPGYGQPTQDKLGESRPSGVEAEKANRSLKPAPEASESSQASTKAEPEAESGGWHGDKSGTLYRCAPGTEISSTPGRLVLERGEAVIEPNRPVTVLTPLGETHIMHKAAVLFKVQKGSERCMVLWDNGPDSVVLVSQKRKLSLGPGKEALITDHDPNYREISESDDIGRRRIKLHELEKHQHVVTSEFSLLHALQRDPLLYDLAHSTDRYDHALREHILKTAAVLNYVTRGHGFYATSGF
jgi:hypothetical protein